MTKFFADPGVNPGSATACCLRLLKTD